MGALGGGDRIFPGRGAGSGGGNDPGGAFTPTVLSSLNLTGITANEGQWSERNKVLTVVGWVTATTGGAGVTAVEIDLPLPADSIETITGVLFVGTAAGANPYVKPTPGGAGLQFTALLASPIVMQYQITYKSST